MLRLLRPDGYAYFEEMLCDELRTDEKINSFEDFAAKFRLDYDALEERRAWSEGRHVTIKLARLPTRLDNESGYRAEFEGAGFHVDQQYRHQRYTIVHARTGSRTTPCT
jgi:hypothetical protein